MLLLLHCSDFSLGRCSVWEDRLTNEHDVHLFDTMLREELRDGLQAEGADAASAEQTVLYADIPDSDGRKTGYAFFDSRSSQVAGALKMHLEDFNAMSRWSMTLSFFPYAVEHACRILRVLQQPADRFGHLMLVGVGGSGRQSLTRLAAHMEELDFETIEMQSRYRLPEWQQDLRTLLRRVGTQRRPTVFFLSDAQVADAGLREGMLEDLSCLLLQADFPVTFGEEETDDILKAMEEVADALMWADRSSRGLWQLFVRQCHLHLRIALSMVPLGGSFHARLFRLPSLINCCTFDWFFEWPPNAFVTVARASLEEVLGSSEGGTATEASERNLLDATAYLHHSAQEHAARYRVQQRRFVYVTSASFLQLLSTFRSLLKTKRRDLQATKARYDDAFKQLLHMDQRVELIRSELAAAQPGTEAEQVSDSRLLLAERLVREMKGLGKHWRSESERANAALRSLIGDAILAAAAMTYLGPFTGAFREAVIREWAGGLTLACSTPFSLVETTGSADKVGSWLENGLPHNTTSIDNGVIAALSDRWPLLIDPQLQGSQWIQRMQEDNNMKRKSASAVDMLRDLELAVQFGTPFMLDHVTEELNPTLTPLLRKQTFRQNGVLCIRFGDNTIEYSSSFSFHLVSKLSNPHFLPEVQAMVTLVNFTVTHDGLLHQLLQKTLSKERPELEQEQLRQRLEAADNRRRLRDTEAEMLKLLGEAQGSTVEEDAAFMTTLVKAKKMFDDSEAKEVTVRATASRLEQELDGYRPVALRGALLFFCVLDMEAFDSMLPYSLQRHLDLFERAIEQAAPNPLLSERVSALCHGVTHACHRVACRLLCQKDELMLSFLMCLRIAGGGTVDPTHHRMLRAISGASAPLTAKAVELLEASPCASWLPEYAWRMVLSLSEVGGSLTRLPGAIIAEPAEWRALSHSETPQLAFPGEWQSVLSSVEKLCVMLCLRPDRANGLIHSLVAKEMGLVPSPFDLEQGYAESSCSMPLALLFQDEEHQLLQELIGFGARNGFAGERLTVATLGQNPQSRVTALVEQAISSGTWVILPNLHHTPSFLPSLEAICDSLAKEASPPATFRLWITLQPSPTFPVSILHSSVVLMYEPPQGLRASMQASLSTSPLSDATFFNGPGGPNAWAWKPLLNSIIFLHAVLLERRAYSPRGFTAPYVFSAVELHISIRKLRCALHVYWRLLSVCIHAARHVASVLRSLLVVARRLLELYGPNPRPGP